MSKSLCEMLEEYNPEFEHNFMDKEIVCRESYEKLKAVAIQLAKGLDVASDVYVMSLDERSAIDGAITRAKDILESK